MECESLSFPLFGCTLFFICLPPNHFPKTKEYKTANAFTTHWRRQGELCRLHYLFTVETGISLSETVVSIPPWSHCGGLQSQILLYLPLSRSSTSGIYYRCWETLSLPAWTPCRGRELLLGWMGADPAEVSAVDDIKGCAALQSSGLHTAPMQWLRLHHRLTCLIGVKLNGREHMALWMYASLNIYTLHGQKFKLMVIYRMFGPFAIFFHSSVKN